MRKIKNSEFKERLKQNPVLRKRLRVFGMTLTLIGGVMILIGLIDFFSSFGSFESPKLFWMLFVGMIVLFPGLVCLNYGYMGAVKRYQVSELAPLAKDTTNYLIEGTRREVAKTIQKVKGKSKICPSCQEELDIDSKFCNHCGYKITMECKNCQTNNDSDSKYCKKCGNELG